MRSPGRPKAPAAMSSTGSNSMRSVTSDPPPGSASRLGRLGLGQQVVEPAGVVALHHHHAVRVEVEHRDRRGRHVHPLEQVEVHAAVVRDRRLDRIGVTHDDDRLVRVPRDDLVERGDRARLHLGDRLAVREAGPRRRDLHDLPLVGLGELGDLAAGPVAVVGFDHAGQRPAPRARGARRSAARSASCARSGSRTPRRSAASPAVARSPRPGRRPSPTGRCPGMRPESSGPVCAVTAWRTSTRRVGGFGFSVAASRRLRRSRPVASVSGMAAKIPVAIPYDPSR